MSNNNHPIKHDSANSLRASPERRPASPVLLASAANHRHRAVDRSTPSRPSTAQSRPHRQSKTDESSTKASAATVIRQVTHSASSRRLKAELQRIALLCLALSPLLSTAEDPRPRLLITTDIGGDPDDQQSMVRLMLYLNEFRLEGLIASAAGTPGELDKAVTKPELIREIVAAYGQVLPRLERHTDGWPSLHSVKALIVSGNPQRGRNAIGDAHDTDASRWIIQRVDAGSPEDPLNISIWGGQTDLAQALWRVQHDRGEQGLAKFVSQFRVYDIADQDDIADWMRSQFPGMTYILSR